MPAAALPTCSPCSSSAAAWTGSASRSSATCVDFFTKSAADILNRYFSHDLVQALFGFDASSAIMPAPMRRASAYVLLHHVFGEAAGVDGRLGPCDRRHGRDHPGDGQGGREEGVEIVLDTPVDEIIVEKRQGGRRRRGRQDLSRQGGRRRRQSQAAVHRLLPEGAVAPEIARRMAHWASESATFRMNVALSELPRFTSLPEPGDHLTAGIIIAPSLDYMDRA